MHTLLLSVSYDGSNFAGFARQIDNKGKELVETIQGDIEHALALIYRREVDTVCAGRTDAGVHARNQRVSFDITDDEFTSRTLERLRHSLNGILPEQVVVQGISEKPVGFSARFDACSREYRYFISEGSVRPVFLRDYSWWVKEDLGHAGMMMAAQELIGEHDFKSFCVAASAKDRTTMRRVDSIEIYETLNLGERCLCVRIVGNAFLHSMVRTIVGTLVEVGTGRQDPLWMTDVLVACDRRAAGPTAPACGLILWEVTYAEEAVDTQPVAP